MAGFKMDDYVDVAERIREFYERFPEGSLKTGTAPHVLEIAGRPFIAYHAQAFRSPDDVCPADGWAWEPVPGPTQFTKDSELMNAETAAWGRAIVALGFKTKKIASAQEMRARGSAQGNAEPKAGAAEEAPQRAAAPAAGTGFATEAQRKRLFALAKESNVDGPRLKEIVEQITGQGSTAQIPKSLYDKVCVAVQTAELAASLADVPFE